MRRTLLACGVASSVLYLATIDVIAPLVAPAYHDYLAQMVSELIARGAPTRSLMVGAFVPYNLLVFAFAAGVWLSAGGRRATRLAAVALVGYGLASSFGLLVAPMDLRSEGLTSQTVLHIWLTALQGICIALVLVTGAFIHGRHFMGFSLATLVVCLLFGAWAGRAVTVESAWLGLIERVSIYAWMIWLMVLAVSLWDADSGRMLAAKTARSSQSVYS